MTQRFRSEQEVYDRLMYPDPDPRVPVNKLGLRNHVELGAWEAELVGRRMRQGLPPEPLELTYTGFKAIHGHLFQDIYEWAGKERTYTTGRNASEDGVRFPVFAAPWPVAWGCCRPSPVTDRTVTPSLILKKLSAYRQQNSVAAALRPKLPESPLHYQLMIILNGCSRAKISKYF